MGTCASYFYDSKNDTATLHNRISVDEKQLELAVSKKNDLLAFIKPRLQEAMGYTVKHWLQGSYKNHTLIRPVSKGEEFDIDIGIYLFCNAETEGLDAIEAKKLHREILNEYSSKMTDAKLRDSKSNCERVAYEPLFHIDIPLYFYDEELDISKLATENNEWIDSDPKFLQDWFNKTVSHLNGTQLARLRRLIRYIKMWVALKWKEPEEGNIPSLAITILVALYYVDSDDDENSFVETIIAINEQLQESFEVKSPINGDDILQLTYEQIEIAKQKFNAIARACKHVQEYQDLANNFILWSNVFEHMFPPYAECISIPHGGNHLPVPSNPPKIRATHYDKTKKSMIGNGVNTSVHACKSEHIYFSIDNKMEYPIGSEIRWTVRNQGEDAGQVNDMGHSKHQEISDTSYELCAYDGIHYVDCMVLKNNSVLGFNSLKVTIQGFARPLRNPAKKRYGPK